MLPEHFFRLNWYYGQIAIKDSWRARSTLFTTSTVFAGICLLLLVLTGLKSGLVKQLYDDIMKSPTSIKGDWYATTRNQALDAAAEKALIADLPPGAVIIPEITKIVSLSTAAATVENVTLQATVSGDPLLGYYGAGIEDLDSVDLIVSPAVARELGISEDDILTKKPTASISLTRGEGTEAATARLKVSITAIVGVDGNKSRTAYLSRKFMEQLEDFTQGEAVVEHGWPGIPVESSIGHQGYLAFSKLPYSSDDLNRLHLRGFRATRLSDDRSRAGQNGTNDLFGLLKPHDLQVYLVTSETQNERLEQYLNFDVSEIENITTSDDVLLYWSDPSNARINGKDHLLIGVSGSMRWLREYFLDSNVRFVGSDMGRVMLPGPNAGAKADLELMDGQHLILDRVPAPDPVRQIGVSGLTSAADKIVEKMGDVLSRIENIMPIQLAEVNLAEKWKANELRAMLVKLDNKIDADRQPIAIVPASLLAAIHRYRQGALAFDPLNQTFQRVNLPNHYFSGRFYARVLEDVPVIDRHLQELGYNTVSSRLRVLEMQGYAGTLDLLVNILQVIAVALGIVTSSVIFMEVTRQRQTSIGIMQIMGMQSQGIFLFVFVRAILIAGLGWAIASLLALLIETGLPILADAECRLTVADYARVLVGAILCSALGVSWHAYAATKLDPMLAIKSGKVQ